MKRTIVEFENISFHFNMFSKYNINTRITEHNNTTLTNWHINNKSSNNDGIRCVFGELYYWLVIQSCGKLNTVSNWVIYGYSLFLSIAVK